MRALSWAEGMLAKLSRVLAPQLSRMVDRECGLIHQECLNCTAGGPGTAREHLASPSPRPRHPGRRLAAMRHRGLAAGRAASEGL